MRIKVGDFDVLESGSVNSYDCKPIEFNLFHIDEAIVVKVIFAYDDSVNDLNKPQAHIEANVLTDDSMEMSLFNWDSASGGTFLRKPLLIGSIGGRELLLLPRVFGASSGHVFHYTWLLGESADYRIEEDD